MQTIPLTNFFDSATGTGVAEPGIQSSVTTGTKNIDSSTMSYTESNSPLGPRFEPEIYGSSKPRRIVIRGKIVR
jgi:hypothetical protein